MFARVHAHMTKVPEREERGGAEDSNGGRALGAHDDARHDDD